MKNLTERVNELAADENNNPQLDSPDIAERIDAKTDLLEEIRHPDLHEEEVLPPMTLEELETFLAEEDARAKEEKENPPEL